MYYFAHRGSCVGDSSTTVLTLAEVRLALELELCLDFVLTRLWAMETLTDAFGHFTLIGGHQCAIVGFVLLFF